MTYMQKPEGVSGTTLNESHNSEDLNHSTEIEQQEENEEMEIMRATSQTFFK